MVRFASAAAASAAASAVASPAVRMPVDLSAAVPSPARLCGAYLAPVHPPAPLRVRERERAPAYGDSPDPSGRHAEALDPSGPHAEVLDPLAETDAPLSSAESVDPRRDAAAPSSTESVDPRRDAAAPSSTESVDPFEDADALEDLGDEIATLAAHIHAATHRLLTLIADFDRRRGWELGGHRSCAHWLAVRTRIDLGTAREKVRCARALTALPLTSAAMARGELSLCAVRALSRVATRENEADLLEAARGLTVPQLEKMVRAFRRHSRKDEAEWERALYESRSLSVFPDEDGMYVVKGVLPAEVGALLMRALEAASDALFRETWGEAEIPDDTGRAAAQRRADAVGLLAERALAAGLGATGSGSTGSGSTGSGATGDGPENVDAATRAAPISGTRAERYQVILHVDADTLSSDGEPGRSTLEDGTRVSCEASRRLCCDAAVVPVTHAADGSIEGVGRRTRTIPPAVRRALEVRDQGCRFPGCHSRFTDAHHVRHWADGGPSSLGNCLLLCPFHHRLVHEGGWRVRWWGEGRPVFTDPRGAEHFEGRWSPPPVAETAQGLEPLAAAVARRVADRGPEAGPGPWTASARWERPEDMPLDVLERTLEALAGGR